MLAGEASYLALKATGCKCTPPPPLGCLSPVTEPTARRIVIFEQFPTVTGIAWGGLEHDASR